MVRENEIRRNERVHEGVLPPDAVLTFIGTIRTPWTSRLQAPRQGRPDGPLCRIELLEQFAPALQGLDRFAQVEVLYWLHLSRRDLLLQSPANDGSVHGTFALRSPARFNPIGTSIARLHAVEGPVLLVRGLDCLDGTPLLDLKPDRALFTPIAPRQAGDDQAGNDQTDSDQTGSDQTGSDQTGSDQTGSDQTDSDRAGAAPAA